MNSLWIFLTCAVSLALAGPYCHQALLDGCAEDMHPNGGGPSFPAALKKECTHTRPAFKCFNDIVHKCPTMVTQAFQEYIMGSYMLLERVCTDRDYQKTYLENAQCFKNVMTHKQPLCEEKATREAMEAQQEPYSCTYYKSIEQCLISYVQDACFPEASGIFAEYLRVIGPVVENGACN